MHARSTSDQVYWRTQSFHDCFCFHHSIRWNGLEKNRGSRTPPTELDASNHTKILEHDNCSKKVTLHRTNKKTNSNPCWVKTLFAQPFEVLKERGHALDGCLAGNGPSARCQFGSIWAQYGSVILRIMIWDVVRHLLVDWLMAPF